MTDPTPGVDWPAKHAAAGQNANREQHTSYTTPDGPITQHQHPLTDTQILDLIEGTQ